MVRLNHIQDLLNDYQDVRGLSIALLRSCSLSDGHGTLLTRFQLKAAIHRYEAVCLLQDSSLEPEFGDHLIVY